MTLETLDTKAIQQAPHLFTAVACYLCGETAARWVHATGSDTSCDRCESAREATYTAQGGQ